MSSDNGTDLSPAVLRSRADSLISMYHIGVCMLLKQTPSFVYVRLKARTYLHYLPYTQLALITFLISAPCSLSVQTYHHGTNRRRSPPIRFE